MYDGKLFHTHTQTHNIKASNARKLLHVAYSKTLLENCQLFMPHLHKLLKVTMLEFCHLMSTRRQTSTSQCRCLCHLDGLL